jgi:hypothetical protein
MRSVVGAPLDDARSVAQVVHHRITQRLPDLATADRSAATPSHGAYADTWTQRTPHGDDPVSKYAYMVAEAMDVHSETLGRRAADDPPLWATRLGPVPTPGQAFRVDPARGNHCRIPGSVRRWRRP